MKRGLLFTTLLVLPLILLSGCDDPIDPQQFNDTVALSQRRLARSAQDFRKTLAILFTAKPADVAPAPVTAAYKKLQETFARVEKTIQEVKPPPTAKGERLKQAYLSYLQKQKKLMEETYPHMVAIATTPGQDPVAKKEALLAIYKQIDAADKEDLEELKKVQKEFGDENKLKLLRDPK